jgi:hypothetical protein
MSAVNPTPATSDNPFAPWAEAWDSALQMQQRWWAQWAEGVQLWTSWWLTPLPPVTPAEWAQTAEQGQRTAGEAAQRVISEVSELPPPSVVMPVPPRTRNQPRPH